MKTIIPLALTLLSTIATASTQSYRIETQVFLDGKLIASPKIVTKGSQAAEVIQVSTDPLGELKLKVVASEATDARVQDGILMKFDVEYLSSTRTVKSSPQILAKAGAESSITVGSRNDEKFEIKVIARRK